jgi:hypothetical protein
MKFLFFILLITTQCFGYCNDKFIVVGHTYPVLNDTSKILSFVDSINKEDVDFVFFLGDCDLWRPEIIKIYRQKLNKKVFFSPGNHDLKGERKKMYLKNVGYFDTLIKSSNANYILINSQNNAKHIKSFIESKNYELDDSKYNIILTHSRIWDDNLISKTSFSHDKSYFFQEIKSHVLKNKINCIFSGNSPSQYFGSVDSTKKANNNIAYWCDIVDNLYCYSIGMGGTKGISNQTIKYVSCEILNNRLFINPKSYEIKKYSSGNFPKSKFEKNKYILENIFLILKYKRFYLGTLIGFLLFYGLNFLLKKRQ